MWIYLFYNLDDVMAQIFGEAKKTNPSNHSQVLLFEQEGGGKKDLEHVITMLYC